MISPPLLTLISIDQLFQLTLEALREIWELAAHTERYCPHAIEQPKTYWDILQRPSFAILSTSSINIVTGND